MLDYLRGYERSQSLGINVFAFFNICWVLGIVLVLGFQDEALYPGMSHSSDGGKWLTKKYVLGRLAGSVSRKRFDLGVVSSSPILRVEFT